MHQLPDWMYHAIEESFTCQFASTTARDIPVALPVFLNHFDPDTATLIISSPCTGYFGYPFTNQPIFASEKSANHRVHVTTISHPSCAVY